MKVSRFRWTAYLMTAMALCNMVLGLGIAPGKTNMQFEPGRNSSVLIRVFNTEDAEFTGIIAVTGDLAPYITLPVDKLYFYPGEPQKNFTYLVSLPKYLGRPGIHNADISVREIAQRPEGTIVIMPTIGVITQLSVFVPFPEKYLEGSLRLLDVPIGEPVRIAVIVTSKGNESIESAYADLSILFGDQVLNSSRTGAISVEESASFSADFPSAGFIPGDYDVSAKVYYDGNEMSLSGSFSILDLLVRIISAEASQYRLGQVLSVKVQLSNIANRLIGSVETRIILGSGSVRTADISGVPISIPAQGRAESELFWDTDGIGTGIYQGNITYSYEDNSEARAIAVILMEEGAFVELDPTPERLRFWEETIKDASKESKRTSAIILVFSVVILSIGAGYLWWKRRRS